MFTSLAIVPMCMWYVVSLGINTTEGLTGGGCLQCFKHCRFLKHSCVLSCSFSLKSLMFVCVCIYVCLCVCVCVCVHARVCVVVVAQVI